MPPAVRRHGRGQIPVQIGVAGPGNVSGEMGQPPGAGIFQVEPAVEHRGSSALRPLGEQVAQGRRVDEGAKSHRA